MSNETNWLKDLPPFQPDEDPQRAERVQKRVLQKLDEPVAVSYTHLTLPTKA